jgi:hypothetical protein
MSKYTRSSAVHKLKFVWRNMKYRCFRKENKDYKWYGGKGIIVCEEWMVFENFLEWALRTGYDDSLTIDRMDSNKDYCPENCVWHTRGANSRRAVEKFTIAESEEMRDMYGSGLFTYKEIGLDYNCTGMCVWAAVNRKTYKKGDDRGNSTVKSN